jgi:hypothetical protein
LALTVFLQLGKLALEKFHGEKDEKNKIKRKKRLRNTVHVWCAVRNWLWRLDASRARQVSTMDLGGKLWGSKYEC